MGSAAAAVHNLAKKQKQAWSKQASKQIDIELRIQNANDVVNLALRKRKKSLS